MAYVWTYGLHVCSAACNNSLQMCLLKKVSAFNYSESKEKGDKHREALPKDKIA
jgi:hypothetical protein